MKLGSEDKRRSSRLLYAYMLELSEVEGVSEKANNEEYGVVVVQDIGKVVGGM